MAKGPAGVFDIYFEATDNQGNKNVSSVMRREVFFSETPEFEFQPASFATVATGIDNGTFIKGEALITYSGFGYNSAPRVVFHDPLQAGTGASGYAIINDGKVVRLLSRQGEVVTLSNQKYASLVV